MLTVASVLNTVLKDAVIMVHGAVGASEVKVNVMVPMKLVGGTYIGFKSFAFGINVPPDSDAVHTPVVAPPVIVPFNCKVVFTHVAAVPTAVTFTFGFTVILLLYELLPHSFEMVKV